MKKGQTHISWLAAFLCLLALPNVATAACAALQNVEYKDVVNVDPMEIYQCIESGQALPQHLTGNLTMQNNLPVNLCHPRLHQACPNTLDAYSDVWGMARNWSPSATIGSIVSQIDWEKMIDVQLPCGGSSTLSQMILESMWGNVRFTLNQPAIPQLKNLINSTLQVILRTLGGYASCQDGTFWGIASFAINKILPQITSGEAGFKHVFDKVKGTIQNSVPTFIVLPQNTSIQMDLMYDDAQFTLPSGASFTDVNGQNVQVPANTTVHFSRSGRVTTSNGQRYQVDPRQIVDLYPENGMLELPPNTEIPVLDPTMPFFPRRPVDAPPSWWDDDIHG